MPVESVFTRDFSEVVFTNQPVVFYGMPEKISQNRWLPAQKRFFPERTPYLPYKCPQQVAVKAVSPIIRARIKKEAHPEEIRGRASLIHEIM